MIVCVLAHGVHGTRSAHLQNWQRRQIISTAVGTLGGASTATPGGALPAHAWCGGIFPGKNPGEPVEETVPFTRGSYRTDVFVRRVMPGRSVKQQPLYVPDLPPVLLVGCPGVAYDYLENLETLVVSGRQVIAVNTCEAPTSRDGRAWLPPPPPLGPLEMRRADVAASQLKAVCEACSLDAVHVFAHGLGGAVALRLAQLMQPAAATGPCLASLTLASPYGALSDLKPMQQRRLMGYSEEVPEDESLFEDGQQCVVEANALTGVRAADIRTDAAHLERAALPSASFLACAWKLCRTAIHRHDVTRATAFLSGQVPWREALLQVSSGEAAANRLGDSALEAKLPPPSVPILLSRGGDGDPVLPSWELGEGRDVKKCVYPFSGHLPFLDKASREEYLMDLLEFYDRVDAHRTPRRGLYDGRG